MGNSRLARIIDRTERLEFFKKIGEGSRKSMKVWEENIWVITNGIFSLNPLASLLR